MVLRSSIRSRGADCGPVAHLSPLGGHDAIVRQALEHGVERGELVTRIAEHYGVDRARAGAAADLYMRQLGPRAALAEF